MLFSYKNLIYIYYKDINGKIYFPLYIYYLYKIESKMSIYKKFSFLHNVLKKIKKWFDTQCMNNLNLGAKIIYYIIPKNIYVASNFVIQNLESRGKN